MTDANSHFFKAVVKSGFLLSIVLSSLVASSQSLISSAGLTLEQDVFLYPLDEDRNYTMGGGFNFSSERLSQKLEPLLRLKNESQYIYLLPTEINIHIAGFTPDELRAPNPIRGDRPYASLAMLSVKDIRVDQINYVSRSWTGGIGIMGVPGVARDIQTWIHEMMNDNNTKPPFNPEGWHNQVSHGGELTLLVSYQKKRLLTTKSLEDEAKVNAAPSKRFRTQVSTMFNFDALYIMQANYGAEVRFGILDLRNWYTNRGWVLGSLPTAAPGDEAVTESKSDYFNKKRSFELYGFASMRSGILLYNASLHGQFRESAYTIPYNETGFSITTGRLGLAVSNHGYALSIYAAFKTPEFWNQFSRFHYWGGFNYTKFFNHGK